MHVCLYFYSDVCACLFSRARALSLPPSSLSPSSFSHSHSQSALLPPSPLAIDTIRQYVLRVCVFEKGVWCVVCGVWCVCVSGNGASVAVYHFCFPQSGVEKKSVLPCTRPQHYQSSPRSVISTRPPASHSPPLTPPDLWPPHPPARCSTSRQPEQARVAAQYYRNTTGTPPERSSYRCVPVVGESASERHLNFTVSNKLSFSLAHASLARASTPKTSLVQLTTTVLSSTNHY